MVEVVGGNYEGWGGAGGGWVVVVEVKEVEVVEEVV